MHLHRCLAATLWKEVILGKYFKESLIHNLYYDVEHLFCFNHHENVPQFTIFTSYRDSADCGSNRCHSFGFQCHDNLCTTTRRRRTTTIQSTDDSFSVQVPEGWVIQELSDTGSELGVEVSEGLRILVQLCPEEEQQRVFPNASGGSSTDSTSNSCQGAQEEVIHIVQYPDLETGVQEDNNITTYHLQKLQEVGYSNIQIVNNTDMTVNIANPQTDETIATVPAKLVEMTYSTNVDLNETRTGYFILTATAATDPDVGTIKGYAIFYEGNSTTAAIAAETTTASSSFLPPLPPAVGQIFDSFELIAAEEVAEAIAQGESEAGADETDEGGDDGANDDDNAGANDDDNAGAMMMIMQEPMMMIMQEPMMMIMQEPMMMIMQEP